MGAARKFKIRKIGNSQGLLFPAELLKELKIHIGQEVEATVYDGVLVIAPSTPSLEDLLESVPKGKGFSEANTGKSRGGEK